MSAPKLTITHTIRWRTSPLGARREVSATGYELETVVRSAETLATSVGWTPRKWWQFWRWGGQ